MSKKIRVFSVKTLLISIIDGYRKFVSPILIRFFGNACRFTPTCSEYSSDAIKKYGVVKGIFLGLKRFGRCHPFGGSGYDPVQ